MSTGRRVICFISLVQEIIKMQNAFIEHIVKNNHTVFKNSGFDLVSYSELIKEYNTEGLELLNKLSSLDCEEKSP